MLFYVYSNTTRRGLTFLKNQIKVKVITVLANNLSSFLIKFQLQNNVNAISMEHN